VADFLAKCHFPLEGFEFMQGQRVIFDDLNLPIATICLGTGPITLKRLQAPQYEPSPTGPMPLSLPRNQVVPFSKIETVDVPAATQKIVATVDMPTQKIVATVDMPTQKIEATVDMPTQKIVAAAKTGTLKNARVTPAATNSFHT
jgi:hypothetical protein